MSAIAFSQVTNAAYDKVSFIGHKVVVNEGSSLAKASSVTVTVDYIEQTVHIFAPRMMPPCPAGMACVMMMPAPYSITLPITNMTEDNCGIKKVVATVDKRPVDGLMTKVTLTDATETSCMFVRAPDQKLQMTEKFVNRQNGKTVTNVAKLNLSTEQIDDSNP